MLHQAYNNGPVPIQAAARHMTEARGKEGGGVLMSQQTYFSYPCPTLQTEGTIADASSFVALG